MHSLSPSQCRAAQALLDWSQPDLSKKCDMHVQTISGFENETSTPTKTTLEKIKLAFENAGIEFSKHDGVCKREDLIIRYEGHECFERFLSDAYITLKHSNEKLLFSGGDAIKSTEKAIHIFRKMIKSGVQIRSLIENNSTTVMGNISNYRWMPDDLFIDTDVKVIYGVYIAYMISWHNEEKVIVIKDKSIAEEARRNFNYIWNLSKPVTHSTSKIKL